MNGSSCAVAASLSRPSLVPRASPAAGRPQKASRFPLYAPSHGLSRSVATWAKKRKPSMLERYGRDEEDMAAESSREPESEDGKRWLDIGVKTTDFSKKMTKPVVLANGDALVVYRVGDDYFCSDAYSTAFKFPMSDAKIVVNASGPVAEVPLDGTVYSLSTGEVITWCPKNNPVRNILNTLKDQVEPEPLVMHKTKVEGDSVMCLLK